MNYGVLEYSSTHQIGSFPWDIPKRSDICPACQKVVYIGALQAQLGEWLRSK